MLQKLHYCILLVTLLALTSTLVSANAQNSGSSKSDNLDDEYNWDYDPKDDDGKLVLSKADIISLTRDWLARDNPDLYPANGFFPVWAMTLAMISAFFLLLAVFTGMLHILGCRGRRPAASKGNVERRLSNINSSQPLFNNARRPSATKIEMKNLQPSK